jgi:hypothetical protein
MSKYEMRRLPDGGVELKKRKRNIGYKLREYVLIPGLILGAIAAAGAIRLPVGREYTGRWNRVPVHQGESVDLLAGRYCRDTPLYREDWWRIIAEKNGLPDYTGSILRPQGLSSPDTLWIPDSTDARDLANYITVRKSGISKIRELF